MDVSSTKPKPLPDTTPLTCEGPKKAPEKKKPESYEPPPTATASEKKGILGFYAAATAPLPNGSGGSPLLPNAPPPPLPKNGTTGNPLMDAVVPPPAQGAPQLMIAAKKPFPSPNDGVGPAAATGAVKDPEVAAEVAKDQAEADAEAECKAVVGMPFDQLHVRGVLKPAKRIAEDVTADALCKPAKKEMAGPLSNVPQTKKPETHAPQGGPNENDLTPKPPAYVPIAASQGTAATSVKQKPSSSAGACPVPPKASTPANATTSNADGTVS